MPVRFPIGIALVWTCGPIIETWARMPSGVSSIKPLGAVENPGSVGDAAWQGHAALGDDVLHGVRIPPRA